MIRVQPKNTLLLIGLALLGGFIVLRTWSASLTSTDVAGTERTLSLVVLLSAMGGLFLWTTRLVPRLWPTPNSPLVLIACIAIGVLMRLSQWGTAPIYENDYLRYLWDGAVLSSGVDPYENTPASIGTKRLLCSLRRGPAPSSGHPDDCILSDLADESRGLVDRVGYGDLTTIYPPIAQLAFASAYRIEPFSLHAWRAILLCAELLTLTALIGALLATRDNPLWVLVYWWNPIVIVHIANGAHIEALLVPLLVTALWSVSRQCVFVAAIAIAAAAAVKIWPLVLLPSLLSASSDRKRNRRAVLLGSVVSGLLLWPQLRHLHPDSGVSVFATEWVRNSFVFPWMVSAWSVPFLHVADADHAARLTVLAIALLISLRNAVAGPGDLATWAQRWGVCVAALFLLVPTGYPWYFIGIFPFLCFWHARAMYLLPIVLPIYFALYIVEPLEDGTEISSWLVAAEFLPVWAAIAWTVRRSFGQHLEAVWCKWR